MSNELPDVVPPNPADLIESLRDFGYTLPSALADLIDNSITAGSKSVQVIVEPIVPSPHIAILDDGSGMQESVLVEAMRMGTLGPLSAREKSDLGRFGLGMKTASLSQGRCVTVMSKQKGALAVRRWDLDYVRNAKEWVLLKEPTTSAAGYLDRLRKLDHGTVVVIEELDRATFLNSSAHGQHVYLSAAIESVRSHLGMIFHRFIEDGSVTIQIGEGRVPAWDPFLKANSTALAAEKLRLHGTPGEIVISPFVLPHYSRMSDELHEQAAGPRGWNAHQGFYIYRCKRLIVPGTWLNLRLKKEEHFKLARIQVDLTNTMDSRWQLNVMKSHVSAPSDLLDDFKRIASDVRRQASDVYRVRGERQVPVRGTSEQFIWKREASRSGVRFKIDRKHPVMSALLHSGCAHDDLLESVISLIEGSIPIAAMLQSPQKALDGSVSTDPPIDFDLLVDMLLAVEHHWLRTGKAKDEARQLVLNCEPFLKYRDQVLDRLKERFETSNDKVSP